MFTIKLSDMFANQLKEYASQVTQANVRAIQGVARDVAIQGHEKAREIASSRLHSTKMTYMNALSFKEDGGVYTISLDPSANHLETGYMGFSMKEGMLSSEAIVKTGKRAGEKWVRTGKDGSRYAAVPFEHNPSARTDMDQKIQIGLGGETTKGDLRRDMKALMAAFGANGLLKDAAGQNVQGKAWTMTKSQEGPQWSFKDAMGNTSTRTQMASPLLSGLTKIQSGNKSAYLTWRIVSDKSDGWRHPGFSGIAVFPELNTWVSNTLDQKIRELFQEGG
jgi:hypothetical protein